MAATPNANASSIGLTIDTDLQAFDCEAILAPWLKALLKSQKKGSAASASVNSTAKAARANAAKKKRKAKKRKGDKG